MDGQTDGTSNIFCTVQYSTCIQYRTVRAYGTVQYSTEKTMRMGDDAWDKKNLLKKQKKVLIVFSLVYHRSKSEKSEILKNDEIEMILL